MVLKNLLRKGMLYIIILIESFVITFLLFVIIKPNEKLTEEPKKVIETHDNEIYVLDEKVTPKIDLGIITSEIKDIGEFATIEFLYTDAAKYSNTKQIKGLDIPLTKKSFLVKWDGNIKAGIDAEKIEIDTNYDRKIIKIDIPKAKILSHEIDNDSFETLDENNNVFNSITVDDVNSFVGENKKFMEEKFIKRGLLDKAEENAENLITNFLKSNQVIRDEYRIDIRFISK